MILDKKHFNQSTFNYFLINFQSYPILYYRDSINNYHTNITLQYPLKTTNTSQYQLNPKLILH